MKTANHMRRFATNLVKRVRLNKSAALRRLRDAKSNSAVKLDAGQSAALRTKLLADVASLTSAEFAVTWATQALPAKNSLIAADAKLLEDAFEQKLSGFSSSPTAETSAGESPASLEAARQEESQLSGAQSRQRRGIDKSALTVAAPRRYRNREHLRYVAQQPCLVCGRKPTDPHHLGFTQPRALGRKVSDEFAVLLCRGHHRAVHRSRDECAWWKQAGIDPIKIARKLWKETRGMGEKLLEAPAMPRSSDSVTSRPQRNGE
jgi:hypothetical protein